MSPTDETLGSYVDGELDSAAHAELEAAMITDPSLATRVERLRKTRGRLQSAFDPTLHEPVPARLASILGAAGMPRDAANTSVSQLESARAAKAARLRRAWSWSEWAAVAASITLGVLVGYFLLRPGSGDQVFKQQDNELLADGALAGALSTQLASTQPIDASVQVGLSFRTKVKGLYCRTFTISAGSETAGIACRESDAWHVRALTRGLHGADGSGGAQQAGSALPPALLAMVQDEIVGQPLDAADEQIARLNDWRSAQ